MTRSGFWTRDLPHLRQTLYQLRDWSLITGSGGRGYKTGGVGGGEGHVEFYPHEKGGGQKKF